MAINDDFGTEPIVILELEQPRCSLRFGVSPCTATGAPKCYQTRCTCRDILNFTPTGLIKWRFVQGVAGFFDFGSEAGNDIATNGLPGLVSHRTTSTRINIAATREAESPFGIRSNITVQLQDFPFADFVGDYYTADRTVTDAGFWAKWTARNTVYTGMTLRLYEGYRGQALSAMQTKEFILDDVSGPDSQGRVSLRGIDPLRLADEKRTLFPRPTDIRLFGAIDDTATAIKVRAVAADLDDAFGNTAEKYIAIGTEIISYTGKTADGDDWDLIGVIRGTLGTDRDAHSDDEVMQRVGRYAAIPAENLADDLLRNHTPMPAAYLDLPEWQTEADPWLFPYGSISFTAVEPEPVPKILGELCRDCSFFVWWDERAKKVKIRAVRARTFGEAVTTITDRDHITSDGVSVRRDPNARVSTVLMYFQRRNPFDGEEVQNYARAEARIGTSQCADPDDPRLKIFYSRFLTRRQEALNTLIRLLLRYAEVPRYITFKVDAKDRALWLGDVAEITTQSIIDFEGNPDPTLWEVISADEVESGQTVEYEAQSFVFDIKLGYYMADGSPAFADATDLQKLSGGFYAADTGLLPGGLRGYEYG